jgi:cellulose biosynthesis protein BcsQ
VKQSSPQLYYLTIEGESRTLTGVHYSNNSGGVLTYSTIRNCGLGQGIYISGNSSPEISNNIIIGNRYNGILLLTNNTTVQISENVIANNGVINGVKTYDGIHCRSSNNVYLNGSNISVSYGGLVAHRSYVYGGTPNGYYGCNNITTNVIGIISMSDGLLIIGDGNVGTSNNIYANEDFDAQAEVVSTIIANNNYWGDVTTPNVNCDDESEIIIDTWSTSYLTCDPYLANFTSSQSSSTLSFEQKKLLEANSAYSKKQYVLAMSLYKDLISKSKNNNIIRRALSGLFYVLTATNDKQVLEYFISDKANKDELAVYIKELLLHYYITVENFQSAMELANLLIKEYPNSDTEMNALLLLATLKDFRNEYVLISDDAYNKLCTKYETKINKSILEAIKQTTEVESPVIQNSISGSDVISNYPNPFNPSTIIRFNVNRASWVVLKVYDLLGREIVVLQNGWLEAGAHQAVFDATRLSSGIYFYSIEIAGKRTVKKMLLTK